MLSRKGSRLPPPQPQWIECGTLMFCVRFHLLQEFHSLKSLKTPGLNNSKNFSLSTAKVPRVQWPISSISGEGNRPREEEGVAPDQACWRTGRSTKLQVRRPGLESQLCHQVLGDAGQVLFSLWVQPAVVSGWGLGVPGWARNRVGKDRDLHRPGTCVLDGDLKHLY